jgi:hypothetical protein
MKARRRWPQSVAFALVIIATVFWLWFGIGSAYVDGGGSAEGYLWSRASWLWALS